VVAQVFLLLEDRFPASVTIPLRQAKCRQADRTSAFATDSLPFPYLLLANRWRS
jgi:hypothetical protein